MFSIIMSNEVKIAEIKKMAEISKNKKQQENF